MLNSIIDNGCFTKTVQIMRFSIGTDDFKEIRTDKGSFGQLCFYCDKSLLIKDVIDDGAKVIVLPRPRRFGKTLNLSMLKYFFDIAEDNTILFHGLKIAENKNIMENWQGKYPVVLISFKDMKSTNFETFKKDLKLSLFNCYQNFSYLQKSERLEQADKNKIEKYFHEDFDESGFTYSLKYLTEMLEKHHGQKAIVLIDEYDTPLQEAYLRNYFKDAIDPFKTMLGAVLKGNVHVYKSVVTGITRIAKESLFSGVNNLLVYDITCNRYSEYFGFTEVEIKAICDPTHLDNLKSWYNGYVFGDDCVIYNPWSILNFLSNDHKLAPYWINTSSNEVIKENLTADKFENVKTLIDGQSVDVEIEPFTVMDNLKANNSAFWNLLFMAGYLTLDDRKHMRIPNQEILYFFKKVVMEWFGNGSGAKFLHGLLTDFIQGRIVDLQEKLQKLLVETMSFHDVGENTQESFYHGFLLGLTLGLKDRYTIKSNRESGYGRYDIALYPNNVTKDPGVVIEVKMNKESVDTALLQIQDKAYATELKCYGCKTILLYGMHFDGKKVTTKLIKE